MHRTPKHILSRTLIKNTSGWNRSLKSAAWFALTAAFLLAVPQMLMAADDEAAPSGRIAINEIMYHPPNDQDELQYVELYNPGSESVDLSGWSFTKGLEFVFSKGTELSGGAYAIICRNQASFAAYYGAELPVVGVFKGRLSHNGERIELTDARGQKIDFVKYSGASPWPLGADGYGASLERICPKESGNDPANWLSSPVRSQERAAGSPGKQNARFSNTPLPAISAVRFEKVEPNRPVPVTATVSAPSGIQSVTLSWWVASTNGTTPADVPMQLISGDAHRGIYSASIPGQLADRLVRFTVRAHSAAGGELVFPSATEPRPTLSFSTYQNSNSAQVPFFQILTLGAMDRSGGTRFARRPSSKGPALKADPVGTSGSAVIYMPPGGKEAVVFDHVEVRHRKGGVKVHFLKDQLFQGMTGVNVIFEGPSRWVLSEPLAYHLYRLAGVPAPMTEHVRVFVDDRVRGYFLMIEQPNKAFLRRNNRDATGNLYKLIWAGNGVVGQHEKKTNPKTGHGDIVGIVNQLNQTSGSSQWNLIQQQFNVDEVATYYAVNMCIQNWDGFFNNYYAYHDLRPGGKWEVFPWDEDKTWGDYDGASSNYDWYSMPLDYGMNGNKGGGGGGSVFSFFGGGGGGPWGGSNWWRPPGWFSGPLLANPEFRQRFKARLRELCQNTFTPEKLEPAIKLMETNLEAEIPIRAKVKGEDSATMLRAFHNDIESFRRQIVQRRKFILDHLDEKP